MAGPSVRPARADDAEAIAAVQLRAWRAEGMHRAAEVFGVTVREIRYLRGAIGVRQDTAGGAGV